MDVLHPRCCGLDVHKSSISACILLREAGRVQKHQRRFGAMTQELQELAEWLRQFGVSQVAMESSGVYWKPVWNILGRTVHGSLGECAAHQECAWSQDRPEGRGMDCAVAAVWSSTAQLCALRKHSRSTRPDKNAGESVPGSLAHQ